MATQKEMLTFEQDRRSVACDSYTQAAQCVLDHYQLSERDESIVRGLIDKNASMDWLNYMFRDERERLAWIVGSPERGIELRYLASEWPSNAPSLPLSEHEASAPLCP